MIVLMARFGPASRPDALGPIDGNDHRVAIPAFGHRINPK
jgi:hypothetical protein